MTDPSDSRPRRTTAPGRLRRNRSGASREGPEVRRRATSNVVATMPGCASLRLAYAKASAARAKTWGSIEGDFLAAMGEFDANIASGIAGMGELQNGKGDFFNDLLALLLENCAGVELYSRGSVPGLIIPRHNLDITYPSTGVVQFMVEAKAVGTPKHPGNPRQKAIGRAGSADLDKRIKEVGFKTIDLKAEFGRIMASQGGSATAISGDLTGWLRSVRPRSYLFIAARAISGNDHERIIRFANLASLVSDAVGLYCFSPASDSQPTSYHALKVPPDLELNRVLYRACQDLRALKDSTPVIATSPSPAVRVEEVPPPNAGDPA